jgi:hydrogenase 3 maturation protease
MKKGLVLTVGNAMMGDDDAGPLLARLLQRCPLEGWEVLDGGSVPENALHRIREVAPNHVLVVDAADMELATGEIRMIDKNQIGSLFLMTTHSLPLSYLIESIEEFVPRVQMLGIQPGVVAFGCPMSVEVQSAVERVYEWLKENHDTRGAAEPI